MIACEAASPGRPWPRVAGWWLRAALLNGAQVGMVFLAGHLWDGWMVRPTPEMVAAARRTPSSMLPESPMKMRAG